MATDRQLRTDVRRRVLELAVRRLGESQVLVLNGPRAVGKSTVLRTLGTDLGREVLDLDDPGTAAAVRLDPARFLEGKGPVLLDEYARVPELLDAIKTRLNRNGAMGQFVLAGSTRYGTVPAIAQALTGRAHVLQVLPLSQGEITESSESFVENLVAGQPPPTQDCAVARGDYAARVVRGGMPMALRLPNAAARIRWFDQYVHLTLDKDTAEIRRVRRRVVLPKLAAAVASRTAQLSSATKLAQELDLDRSTTEDYLQLLEAVFLHWQLPAFGSTLSARAAATPKLHLTDTGIAARLLRVTADNLLAARPSALQQFGHLLKTFVVNEICKQASWLDDPVSVGHWRTHDGDEVDLVLERTDGSVLAFEVKAAPGVHPEDGKGIAALTRRLGANRVTGFVLYTGKHTSQLAKGITAVPIARLWSP